MDAEDLDLPLRRLWTCMSHRRLGMDRKPRSNHSRSISVLHVFGFDLDLGGYRDCVCDRDRASLSSPRVSSWNWRVNEWIRRVVRIHVQVDLVDNNESH